MCAHIYKHSSPATGNIHILLLPAQRWRRVTVDLTPELHALVYQDHLVHRSLHEHWSFWMWAVHTTWLLNVLLT